MCGDSLSHGPSTPRKTPGSLILPPKEDPWTPQKAKSAPATPKKRSKEALYNSTDDDNDGILWSEDEAEQDGVANSQTQAAKASTPTKRKPKPKTPSPAKKQKQEQSDEDEPLGSPSKRAPAQKWTAGRFNDDSLRYLWTGMTESTSLFDPKFTYTCTEEELQLSRAVHKIALENASAIRDRAGLKNRTANQIGMKLKGEFRKRDKELGGDGKWLDAQIKKST
ncbi:unnamed protein product [Jaminaea pallidilutea]